MYLLTGLLSTKRDDNGWYLAVMSMQKFRSISIHVCAAKTTIPCLTGTARCDDSSPALYSEARTGALALRALTVGPV